jgi:hypothetical protein
MSESSSDEVLLDCSSLPPLARADLQTFLERQPEVQSFTRRLHITDTLLNPDTQGLVSPRFDLVVHLAGPPLQRGANREAGATILKKVAEWEQANRPRVAEDSNRDQ